jgi:hypothetical protein
VQDVGTFAFEVDPLESLLEPAAVYLDSIPTRAALGATEYAPFAEFGSPSQMASFSLIASSLESDNVWTAIAFDFLLFLSQSPVTGSVVLNFPRHLSAGFYSIHLAIPSSWGSCDALHRDIALIEVFDLDRPVEPRTAFPLGTATERQFTAAFAVRKVRVRKIFAFSDLIPVILANR